MGARLASQIREFKITSYSMWNRRSPRLISLLIWKLCLFVCFFTQELINTLLCVDQSKRITATEALKHPWIVVCLCTNVRFFAFSSASGNLSVCALNFNNLIVMVLLF